jgi:hypothetical protein
MNVETLERPASPTDNGHEYYRQYKALSTAAVGSFVLGLASVLALFDWSLLAVPVVGILLSLYSVRQLRLRSAELTGTALARGGLILAVLFLILGAGYQSYEYATEVPEGSQRISYDDLATDPEKPLQTLPDAAKEFDGKRIFIKGYVYPSKDQFGIRQFVLCRDKGDCCFGGNPKITERILVTLNEPLLMNYSPRLYRVAGQFHIEPGQTKEMGGGILYRLKADYLQ